MSVESCIHKSLNFALKVHQIDAFNFNIKKNSSRTNMPPDPLEVRLGPRCLHAYLYNMCAYANIISKHKQKLVPCCV